MTQEQFVRSFHAEAYAKRSGFWSIYTHPDLPHPQAFLGSALTKRDAWHKAAQAIINQRWRTLECVDCKTKIKAPLRQGYDWMRSHVRAMHGREMAFSWEQYEQIPSSVVTASLVLLNPDLAGAA